MNGEWFAGHHEAIITPEHSVWLAGYGGKRAPDGDARNAMLSRQRLLAGQGGVRTEFAADDQLAQR